MSKPPLDGIRVADFCWAWAGPYGALHFAHLGAEVIRIESNTRMCPTRISHPGRITNGALTGPATSTNIIRENGP